MFADAGAQSATTTTACEHDDHDDRLDRLDRHDHDGAGRDRPVDHCGRPTTSTTSTTSTIPVPVIEEGAGFAFLEMPTIDVDAVIVAGVRPADLKKGPGHYPGTPMPGQLGNSAIACHRTTYGQPCFRLDELAVGDEIVVTTVQGRFVYLVTGSEVVSPDRGDVVLTTDPTVAQTDADDLRSQVHGHQSIDRAGRAGSDRLGPRRSRPCSSTGPACRWSPTTAPTGPLPMPAVTTPATLPGSVDATTDSIPAPATAVRGRRCVCAGLVPRHRCVAADRSWAAAAAGVAVLGYVVARCSAAAGWAGPLPSCRSW